MPAGFPDVILAYHTATRTHLGGRESERNGTAEAPQEAIVPITAAPHRVSLTVLIAPPGLVSPPQGSFSVSSILHCSEDYNAFFLMSNMNRSYRH